MINYLLNLLLAILPPTSFFKLKAYLITLMGNKNHKSSKFCGNSRFYGRGVLTVGESTWIGLECIFLSAPDAPITIGNQCDIAPSVKFITGSHEVGTEERRAGRGFSLPIEIGDGTWIGTGSTILGGTILGKSSIIAAGSVVLAGKYPDNVLLAGVPAVVKKKLEVK